MTDERAFFTCHWCRATLPFPPQLEMNGSALCFSCGAILRTLLGPSVPCCFCGEAPKVGGSVVAMKGHAICAMCTDEAASIVVTERGIEALPRTRELLG